MRPGQDFQNSDKRTCKIERRKNFFSNAVILTYLSFISQCLSDYNVEVFT